MHDTRHSTPPLTHSGTFDKNVTAPWPAGGGATASIRFKPEINHAANAGLQAALDLMEPLKQKYPLVRTVCVVCICARQAYC